MYGVFDSSFLEDFRHQGTQYFPSLIHQRLTKHGSVLGPVEGADHTALNRTATIPDKVALKVCSTNSLQNDMGGFGVELTWASPALHHPSFVTLGNG